MTYLITGISGFVGGHYLEYLWKKGRAARIVGVDLRPPAIPPPGKNTAKRYKFYKASLLNKQRISNIIRRERPDFIVHLAAESSVALSWKNPDEYLKNNVKIFLNLIESARRTKRKPRILSVGSAEEYGRVRKKDLPIKESAPLNPNNPYALSRLIQEKLATQAGLKYKIPIVCTRSFNHIGPRQRETFAVSSFAKQVARAKTARIKNIYCGNLKAIRDFSDVRDVVRAYDLLLRKGKPGEVYNVCSGKGYALDKILKMLKKKAGVKTPVKAEKRLMRPIDSPIIIGSPARLKRATGFRKNYDINDTLNDILEWWETKVS